MQKVVKSLTVKSGVLRVISMNEFFTVLYLDGRNTSFLISLGYSAITFSHRPSRLQLSLYELNHTKRPIGVVEHCHINATATVSALVISVDTLFVVMEERST